MSLSPLIQKGWIGCLLLGQTWQHLQSKTIKTKEKTQRLGDLNHGPWQWFPIHQISSAGNLSEAWCRNGLGLTLIFCLYCKAKGWLLPGTLEKYPAPCYQQIFQGGAVKHPTFIPYYNVERRTLACTASGIFKSEMSLEMEKVIVREE